MKAGGLAAAHSLRLRMQLGFLFVTTLSILAMIIFALLHFYFAVREQATRNMREKSEIAMLVYGTAEERTAAFARSLAGDSVLQILLDLDIRNKLSDFVRKTVEREGIYQIVVFDQQLRTLADVSLAGSPMAGEVELESLDRNSVAASAAAGEEAGGTESVEVLSGMAVVSISAACPVRRDNRVVGGVLVRLVLNGNATFVGDIKMKLHTDAAVFAASGAEIVSTVGIAAGEAFDPGSEFDAQAARESIRMWFGNSLEEYSPLLDPAGAAVASLAIKIPADPFMGTFVAAFLLFLGIAALAIGLSSVAASRVARSITEPVDRLLSGVKRIAGGDLGFEIALGLDDEIGRLADAFDAMRKTVREKISTIEEMNANLAENEERLTRTLAEKETLLSELYHRSNNNMQVISSILDIQALALDDRRFEAAISATQGRIGALALVQRMLYDGRDLSHIDLATYIRELAIIVAKQHLRRPRPVETRIDADKVDVLVDTAIPCGLILNELLANAHLHAYPDVAEDAAGGEIHVTLRKDASGLIMIRVADTGRGVPEGFDPERASSLGLMNVIGLATRQLRGTVDFDTDEGFVCEIRFKDDLYTDRV